MSPEERELLNKAVSLGEDNNKMLRAMRRSQRISQFMSFLYWAIIIGSAIGAYYIIQPYVNQLMGAYGSAMTELNDFRKQLR